MASQPFPPEGGHHPTLPPQRWSWANSSCKICDVLYDGPPDWGPLLRATEGHSPHGNGYGILIGYPSGLACYIAASAHHHQSGLQHCCYL